MEGVVARMGQSPSLRVAEHAVCAAAVLWFASWCRQQGLKGLAKAVLGVALKTLPGASAVVDKEVEAELAKIARSMHGDGDKHAVSGLPATGWAVEAVRDEAKRLREQDKAFHNPKAWGGVYYDVAEEANALSALQQEMWGLFNSTNALYPGMFASVRKMEAEIIAIALSLLHTDNCEAAGLLTSGGTESILLAVLAYRERATRLGIASPNIVCCVTAHPALDKACHYFGVGLIKVKACPHTQRLTADAVRRALTQNTVAVYASAPTFPHGVVDPIADLSSLLHPLGIGLHVDNCLGGFYLSFLQRAGGFGKEWDFALPGVTSVSIDVHKYGMAPKGASVVVFRDKELRSGTFFPITSGNTLYVTPTLQGARGGAVMAATWATLLRMGHDGYSDAFSRLHSVFEFVVKAIEDVPGVELLCASDLAVIPLRSPVFDVYALAGMLEKRGWNMFTAKDPPCMSLCLGLQHTQQVIEAWLSDLRECSAFLCEHPNTAPEGEVAVYGAVAVMPDHVLRQVMRGYLDVKLAVHPAHN